MRQKNKFMCACGSVERWIPPTQKTEHLTPTRWHMLRRWAKRKRQISFPEHSSSFCEVFWAEWHQKRPGLIYSRESAKLIYLILFGVDQWPSFLSVPGWLGAPRRQRCNHRRQTEHDMRRGPGGAAALISMLHLWAVLAANNTNSSHGHAQKCCICARGATQKGNHSDWRVCRRVGGGKKNIRGAHSATLTPYMVSYCEERDELATYSDNQIDLWLVLGQWRQKKKKIMWLPTIPSAWQQKTYTVRKHVCINCDAWKSILHAAPREGRQLDPVSSSEMNSTLPRSCDIQPLH